MNKKSTSKLSWPKRLSILGLVLFTLYLCFGIWAVPAILISQIQSNGSEALGRDLRIERAAFNPFSLETKLYGVRIGPADGEASDLLSIGKLSANPQLSSVFGTITIKSIEVSEGDIWVEKSASGRLSFQDILEAQPAAPEEVESGSGELPGVIVKNLLLADVQLHFKDSSLATPYEEIVRVEIFQGRDLGTVEKSGIGESNTAGADYHWDFDGKVSTGSGAVVDIAGGATSLAPWRFRVNTKLVGFPIASLQPYIDESVVARVEGFAGFDLTQTIEILDTGIGLSVAGSLDLAGFLVADEEQLFAGFDSLKIGGVDLDASNMQISIAEVAVVSPQFEAVLLADGSPRLPVMKGSTAASEVVDESEPFLFAANLSSLVLSEGRVLFEDRSIGTPFKTSIDDIELKLSDLTASEGGDGFELSAGLELLLKVLGGDLEIKLNMESLEGKATANVSLAGLQLKQLQPYVAEHANAEIDDGHLSLNLDASLFNLKSPKVSGSLGLQQMKLSEVGSEKQIATLSNLEIAGVDFSDGSLRIEAVRVVEPIVAAWQDNAGINLSRIAKLEAEVEQKAVELEEGTGLQFYIDRFEVKSAGVGFVDTTLLSTHNSRVSDFDLTMEDISSGGDKLSGFSFSGVVDSSARLAGKGSLRMSDPGKHLDLDMSFRGYDLTSTSPYWATYLGRKLAKGQFEIISHYTVRDNQLEGTNDFKIDQLTLGEKVESERAISLPLGFAIKLMQDPSGMIDYKGLPVSGDLADPQVKPWGLVGRAVRNLMLNAVASPFKFLAKLGGGRDDLDSIAFAVSEVKLDKEALEKIAAIRKLMGSRPGLNLEVSFLPDPSEQQYLKNQYALHLIANPEFQVVSGLDLLLPVNPTLLETAVIKRYNELHPMDTDTDTESMEAGAEMMTDSSAPKPDAVASGTKKKGLVKKLASILTLGKSDTAKSAEEPASVEIVAAVPDDAPGPEVEEAVGRPSFEEMLAAVLEVQSLEDFDGNWINDLSKERIQKFKTALLESGEIAGSRVFSTEVNEVDVDGSLGSILIRLAE